MYFPSFFCISFSSYFSLPSLLFPPTASAAPGVLPQTPSRLPPTYTCARRPVSRPPLRAPQAARLSPAVRRWPPPAHVRARRKLPSRSGDGCDQIGVPPLHPPRRGGGRGGDAVAVSLRAERHLLQPHHHLLENLLPVSPPSQTPTTSCRSLLLACSRSGNLAEGLVRGFGAHGQPSVTVRRVQIPGSFGSSRCCCYAWRRLWCIVNWVDITGD